MAPPAKGEIHPTAVISDSAVLGENVSIGAYTVIGENVKIGDFSKVYPNVTIYDNAVIYIYITFRECIGNIRPKDINKPIIIKIPTIRATWIVN